MATIRINEANGAGQTVTNGITNTNMGSTDAANLNADNNPITPDDNSFEKWQKIEVTDMAGASVIKDAKIWRTGALGANASHVTNARTSSYGGAETYATPTASTSSVATQTMPTSEPGTANLGIGGSLSGTLTAVGSTDYLVHQIQTTSSATAGSTSTMNYQVTVVT
jgi:hypothetical protein